jgi:pyruvate,water dikinase
MTSPAEEGARMATTEETAHEAFPSPFAAATPSGCEGWEDLYAHHAVFSADRRAFDEDRFWFHDAMHFAEPVYPFDAVALEGAQVALNQASARLFAIPPSLGIESRLLNGYVYFSTNSVTDEATLARRAEVFTARGGYYYEHWDELYASWLDRVQEATGQLLALEVPELPEFEDELVVTEGRGSGSSHALLLAYDRLLEGLDRIWQYHFEFLNLGYAAYLVFYDLCRQLFPGISEQAIAKMVSGIDVVLWRPDEELKRLARLAVDLGVTEVVKAARTEEELRGALAASAAGEQWLADLDATKDPWFYFSLGTGAFYHHHRSWIDDAAVPIAMIRSYVERLQAGEDISRPYALLAAERERITEEYRSLLGGEARAAFDERIALACTVFPYVENHNFYIDHRYLAIFWNKVREFGALLAAHGFLADGEDVFFLRHDEVRSALEELRLAWSSGGAGCPRGPGYWPPLVEWRKSIYEALRGWAPPPALGRVPETISDPITVMLWGITDERVQEWLSASAGFSQRTVTGLAGSPGIAEGRARVIVRPDQLDQLIQGEILVAPCTATSWTPVFGKIAAAVLDIGGMMSHAAIVAREYGLPAVVGTGTATRQIKTGDLLRVDAHAGVVTILDGVAQEPLR